MTQYPMNTAGMAYFEIKEISVNEWHPLPDGQGQPEQLHMMVNVDGFPHPLVIRYKSRRPVDELIVALIAHAEHVWPRKNTGDTSDE